MASTLCNLIVAIFLVATVTAQAEILIDRNDLFKNILIRIWITGTITERDGEDFQVISKEFEYATPQVNLDSRGGDVFAAIKIGRLIRKYDGTTVIGYSQNSLFWPRPAFSSPPSKCYSSCALIFIAGVERKGFDELGLHRPYLAAAPQSRVILEKRVPLMLSMVKSYVAEMGITDNFYQQMVNTEPSKIMIYKGGDIERLVPVEDAVYAEIKIAQQARRYGITTSEMRQRNADAKGCGTNYDARGVNCLFARLWALSEPVYIERRERARKECEFKENQSYSDEERATYDKTPHKLREALAFVIREETCTRNIMLGR
jgi:hypothetical protein